MDFLGYLYQMINRNLIWVVLIQARQKYLVHAYAYYITGDWWGQCHCSGKTRTYPVPPRHHWRKLCSARFWLWGKWPVLDSKIIFLSVFKIYLILPILDIPLFFLKVTGDNVRSLVLCDFTADGKNEVRHYTFRFHLIMTKYICFDYKIVLL